MKQNPRKSQRVINRILNESKHWKCTTPEELASHLRRKGTGTGVSRDSMVAALHGAIRGNRLFPYEGQGGEQYLETFSHRKRRLGLHKLASKKLVIRGVSVSMEAQAAA